VGLAGRVAVQGAARARAASGVRAPAQLSSPTLTSLALLRAVFTGGGPLARRPPPRRSSLAGFEADLYLPGRQGPHPGLLLVQGALLEGRAYPPLVRVAEAAARAGFAVCVPELGRLRDYVVDAQALADLLASAAAFRRHPEVRGRVALFGFSLGGGLALLAAEQDADDVLLVAALGGCYDLRAMVAAAAEGRLEPTAALAVAATTAAGAGEAVLDELSAIRHLERVRVPVWLLHDRDDRFVPVAQTLAVARDPRARRFRVFITRVLAHTEPDTRPASPVALLRDYLPGLLSLFRFVRGPVSLLQAPR
jgi:pimeloyl-ACP methyl ester carboxylesterase